jgi:hypothetical protein
VARRSECCVRGVRGIECCRCGQVSWGGVRVESAGRGVHVPRVWALFISALSSVALGASVNRVRRVRGFVIWMCCRDSGGKCCGLERSSGGGGDVCACCGL